MSKVLTYASLFATGLLLEPAQSHASNAPQTVLVELFTSEGCSSCPPADRLLAELDRKQPIPGTTIIVLSEHVDYWNYLGWRDPYSSSKWSERQSYYGRRFGLDSVYTPQMVVNGAREVNGSDGSAVLNAIEKSATSPAFPIAISSLDRAGNSLRLTVSATAGPGASLYAAIADDADRSSVQRGENEGRTLDHIAVLRSLQMVANLQSPLVGKLVTIPLPSGSLNRPLRIILFAQDEKSGHVLGVAERGF